MGPMKFLGSDEPAGRSLSCGGGLGGEQAEAEEAVRLSSEFVSSDIPQNDR
jgi:hypothetical protein